MEKSSDPEVARGFLRWTQRLHEELKIPVILSALGRSVGANAEDLNRFCTRPLFEPAQQKYSHVGLKTLGDRVLRWILYIEGATTDVVPIHLEKAQAVFVAHVWIGLRSVASPHFYRTAGGCPKNRIC